MNFAIEDILLISAVLLLISIVASKSFGRLGVPALILFLGVGILSGSEGIGGIYFDDPDLAQSISVVAFTFILFSGGLDTKWTSVKPVLPQGIVLSTLGVLLTALTVGVFVTLITDFTLLEGLLLGSVVSSTDAAAVFSILRSKSVALKNNIKPLLELESGSNDPMAYILTICFTFLLVNPDTSYLSLLLMFLQQMFLGACMGIAMGYITTWFINRINLDYEGLYAVITLSFALITYAATTEIGGNGFLAVYIAAVWLGNQNFIHKASLLRFHDSVAWLMQILMFLTLGLLVFPNQVVPIIGIGLLISFFLMFIARPLGVFICLLFFKNSVREKSLISWVGLRGAAPILFATYPLIEGVPQAGTIFNLVFFMVLTSVMLQGTTISLVANWLGLAEKEQKKLKHSEDLAASDEMANELFEVQLHKNSHVIGKRIVELGFPKNSLIVLIKRDDKYVTPNGSTVLEAGDKLTIMAEDLKSAKAIEEMIE